MSGYKIAVLSLIILLFATTAVTIYQYSLSLELSSQRTNVIAQLEDTSARIEMNNILSMVQTKINIQLEQIDASIMAACAKLSAMDLMGEQARVVLDDLAASNPFIVNAATADANDTLLVVAPREYSYIEAINICYQEQNIKMHTNMRPAMSSMVPLVEGFYGVVMVAPIFSPNNTFIGSLSVVIQPSEIIQAIVAPALEGTNYSMWAMQANGTLLYDPDPLQQGKNLFTDPIYVNHPTVQAFVQEAANTTSGYGTYNYYQDNIAGEMVNKEAYWSTAGIYDGQWRIIVARVLDA